MTTGTTPDYCYDAAGNLVNTSTCSTLYVYDAENRLTAYGTSYTYTYDGDGKRVKKDQTSGSTYDRLYWYGLGLDVLAESDLSGNLTEEYVFFAGLRVARRNVSSGNIYYYLADHVGTSRAIVQAGQTSPCYDADFYPFGGERVVTNTCTQNYKFTGKEREGESGLDYFVARHYPAWMGRFLQPDPLSGYVGDPQSLNLYAYVRNNPLNLIDPDGRRWWTKCNWEKWGFDDDGGREVLVCEDIYIDDGLLSDIGSKIKDGATKLVSQVKNSICSTIPEGRTEAVSGSYGEAVGVTGSIGRLVNYNTGEVSRFSAKGLFVGLNGAASVSASVGFVTNLGADNSRYGGGFQTSYGSAGYFGAYRSASTTNSVREYGATVGAAVIPRPASGGVSETDFSVSHEGNILTTGAIAPFAKAVDIGLYLAQQVCKG